MDEIDRVIAGLTHDDRADLLDPDNKRGHLTRSSDSSIYDEKCTLCGLTDGSLMWRVKRDIYNTDCTVGLSIRARLQERSDG